jgi:hypothetical protein
MVYIRTYEPPDRHVKATLKAGEGVGIRGGKGDILRFAGWFQHSGHLYPSLQFHSNTKAADRPGVGRSGCYPLRRFWENLPSCRSRVAEPRMLVSDGRLAFDKYIPTSVERSVFAWGGLNSRLHPLTIMRIQ